MEIQLFHIFRNNALGRETLLQSIWFAQKTRATLSVYVPAHTKFLMYFENDVVQVDLDGSFLTDPDTARGRVVNLAEAAGLTPRFIEPKAFTATTLPDLPVNFDFMTCPRTVTELSSKIGLGYIGPRVRGIVKSARFPVLVAAPVYKPWERLAVFFGGSENGIKALKLGFRMARLTGMPLDVFTQAGDKDRAYYEDVISKEAISDVFSQLVDSWTLFDSGAFEDNLYAVPHDALCIVGAYGHGVIKDILFGSMVERIQATLPNPLMMVGPHYSAAG